MLKFAKKLAGAVPCRCDGAIASALALASLSTLLVPFGSLLLEPVFSGFESFRWKRTYR